MMSQGEHWVNAITKQLQEIARSKHKGNSLKKVRIRRKWKETEWQTELWGRGAGLFMVDVSKKDTLPFPFLSNPFLPFILHLYVQ